MKFYRENNVNPAASCLPLLFQFPVFIALFLVLRDFAKESHRSTRVDLALVAALVPEHHRPRERALVGLPAARHLRRQPAALDLLHVDDDGQDAADADHDPAVRVRPFLINFPVGLMHLLGDDEPVDDRAGPRHAPPGAARSPRRRRNGRRGRRPKSRRPKADGAKAETDAGRARSRSRSGSGAAPRKRVRRQEEEDEPGDDRGLFARSRRPGETVGEAKWAALRELEQLLPGLDKSATSSSRSSPRASAGLLGVGYAPARVIASVGPDSVGRPSSRRPTARASSPARSCASSSSAIMRRDRRSLPDRRSMEDDETADRVLLGLEPRPPDRQARADDRRDPVPRERDRLAIAAGRPQGRRRRRGRATASGAARRSSRSPCAAPRRRSRRARPIELEPMTAAERKIVHLALQGIRRASRPGAKAPSRTASSSSAPAPR